MTEASPIPMSDQTQRPHRPGYWLLGPAAIAIAMIVMLIWTWGTWPDPLVDYGTHLYIPWQLSRGAVLYRDIALYNGPFSPYLNAAIFRLFGVGIDRLEAANLLVLLGVMAMMFRLTEKTSGRVAAVWGGLTIVLVFAFGQGVGIGNYNWMTPYAHELTHGVALSLLALMRFDRCFQQKLKPRNPKSEAPNPKQIQNLNDPNSKPKGQRIPFGYLDFGPLNLFRIWCFGFGIFRHRRHQNDPESTRGYMRWAALAGLFTGAACLTKAEPGTACIAGVMSFAVAGLWVGRSSPRQWVRTIGVLVGSALLLPIVAFLLLASAMPASMALRGVLGSWPWVFDRRVTSLPFYRGVVGLNDISGNLLKISEWSLGYVLIAGVVVLVGKLLRRSNRAGPPIVFAVAAAAAFITLPLVDWRNALLPLPVFLAALVVWLGVAVWRREPGSATRFGLVVFSLALLPKIVLKTHAYHYGFALAMPGTLVMVAFGAEQFPGWVRRRGDNAGAVRAILLAVWIVFVASGLLVERQYLDLKRWTIEPGTPDSFRASTRGLEVTDAVKWIDARVPATGTVAVLPQGLMINYLARRAAPTRYVNFMPPQVVAAGEQSMLAALSRQLPAAIVIDRSATQDGQFTLAHKYQWGVQTRRWIAAHYQLAFAVVLPPPMPTLYGFEIYVPKIVPGKAGL